MIKVLLLIALAATALADRPVFPTDWTAAEINKAVIYQGSYSYNDGNYCCNELTDCQVQTQAIKGVHYYAYYLNRTRFDYAMSGEVIVTAYDIGKQMLINPSTMECIAYCPTSSSMRPGFLSDEAKDMGKATYKGRAVEMWQYNETLFDIIVMETVTLYVDQSNPQAAIPVAEVDRLTPFGQEIGTFTTEWLDFKPGQPDAKLFNVQGIDKCPLADNCNSDSFQLLRLRYHDHQGFHHYRSGGRAFHRRSPRHNMPHTVPAPMPHHGMSNMPHGPMHARMHGEMHGPMHHMRP